MVAGVLQIGWLRSENTSWVAGVSSQRMPSVAWLEEHHVLCHTEHEGLLLRVFGGIQSRGETWGSMG